jgi:hypothetical protein
MGYLDPWSQRYHEGGRRTIGRRIGRLAKGHAWLAAAGIRPNRPILGLNRLVLLAVGYPGRVALRKRRPPAAPANSATLRSFFDRSGGLARGTGFLTRFLVAWASITCWRNSAAAQSKINGWPRIQGGGMGRYLMPSSPIIRTRHYIMEFRWTRALSGGWRVGRGSNRLPTGRDSRMLATFECFQVAKIHDPHYARSLPHPR